MGDEAAETVQRAYDVLEGFYKDNDLMLLQRRSAEPVPVEAAAAVGERAVAAGSPEASRSHPGGPPWENSFARARRIGLLPMVSFVGLFSVTRGRARRARSACL